MSDISNEIVKKETSETSVTKAQSESSLSPPKPKQIILKEEDYVESIEAILERDFFPDLPKLNNHLEWLEAVKNHDLKKMQEIQSRYRSKKKSDSNSGTDAKPFETPNFAETPINKKRRVDPTIQSTTTTEQSTLASSTPFVASTPSTHTTSDTQTESTTQPNDPTKPNIENISLDSFLNKYTSEDDASFSKFMKESHEKHKKRYPWLHENQPTQRLAFEGPENERPAGFLTWGHTAQNALMYHPEGLPPSVEPTKISAETKKIVPENTRLRITFEKPKPQQPKKKEEVDVYKLLQDPVKLLEHKKKQKDVKVDLDDLRKTPAHSTSSLASVPPSPQVNGWSFVATPSPAPGEDHEPFITWGNIEGTPLLLSEPTDTPIVVRDSEEPTFKVPELTKRELIALKLADQVQFKRKKKITQQGDNPAMSPAVQRLLQSTLAQKLKSPDFSLRAAYNSPLHPLTPIRSLAKGATPSLTPSHPISSPKLNLTPVVEINRKKRKFSSEPPPPDSFQRSLTDNLLFIPPASNTTKNNTNTPDTNKNNSHSRNESEKNEKNDQKVLNANKEKNVNEEIEKQLRDKLESQHRQQQSQ